MNKLKSFDGLRSLGLRSLDGRALSVGLMAGVAVSFVGLAFVYPQFRAIGGYMDPTPPPVITPPKPVFTPPPIVVPPPTFTPPVVVPTDVTFSNASFNANQSIYTGGGDTLRGLSSAGKAFPQSENLTGSTDFILVKAKPNSSYDKISPYAIELKSGVVLVAVRKPSNTGMVLTPLGEIAVFANADVMISFENGVLRILNFDGMGDNVKIKLTGSQFGKFADQVYTIKPGFEFVASDKQLTPSDLRPSDGIGRRGSNLIDNKHVAIGQFSVESVLKGSDLIASMNQSESDSKDRRVIGDMSKMAAVLNSLEGTFGYSASGNSSSSTGM